jgi:hypothetical protein
MQAPANGLARRPAAREEGYRDASSGWERRKADLTGSTQMRIPVLVLLGFAAWTLLSMPASAFIAGAAF